MGKTMYGNSVGKQLEEYSRIRSIKEELRRYNFYTNTGKG